MIRATAVALLIFTNCVYAQNGASSPAPCTRNEAIAAEFVIDFLTTWDNVYQFHRQYKHCIDAAIAEGVHDRIQRLWANQWSTLPRMISLMDRDEVFRKFVWQALQTEAFPRDAFQRVLAQAKQQCPHEALEFCKAVIAQARKVQ